MQKVKDGKRKTLSSLIQRLIKFNTTKNVKSVFAIASRVLGQWCLLVHILRKKRGKIK